jgi:hypothetical protein
MHACERLSRSAFFGCLANADNNSDLRGRLNARRRFATFMMARALRAHRKAGQANVPFRFADDQDRSSAADEWCLRGESMGGL